MGEAWSNAPESFNKVLKETSPFFSSSSSFEGVAAIAESSVLSETNVYSTGGRGLRAGAPPTMGVRPF